MRAKPHKTPENILNTHIATLPKHIKYKNIDILPHSLYKGAYNNGYMKGLMEISIIFNPYNIFEPIPHLLDLVAIAPKVRYSPAELSLIN